MNEQFNYDVFISHSKEDKPAARELAERLRRDGLRVWFDEWEIKPGDSIPLKIQNGLEQSRTLVLMMSANVSASEWVMFERQAVIFRDPANQKRRFIPLRLDNGEIPEALKQYASIDWTERSENKHQQLIDICRLSTEADLAVSLKDQNVESVSEVLAVHHELLTAVALTFDGGRAITGSHNGTVRVWDLSSGECVTSSMASRAHIQSVAVTKSGDVAVTISSKDIPQIWELTSNSWPVKLSEVLRRSKNCVAITGDGGLAMFGCSDGTLEVWNLIFKECTASIRGHSNKVNSVAVTPDGQLMVSGSLDQAVSVWNWSKEECLATFNGHTGSVQSVAVTPDGRLIISGSTDKTVRVWDLWTGKCIAIFEGHTRQVLGVAVTTDGKIVVSASEDGSVRVWGVTSKKCIAVLKGHADAVNGVAVTPDGNLVVSVSHDGNARIWNLSTYSELIAQESATYTNAKVLLVGESGVGKSGLAIRLTEHRFEPTISTDAAWATQMKLPHDVSTKNAEREIWLWDFAGQADYRLIHQLYMDETSLAALVFNPQSENPFEGLGQWDRDLQRAARRSYKKLLVAGRCDRGKLMVSRESVERFIIERGFAEYLETSAYTGVGCDELKEAIIKYIPWDDIPWTTSPLIFKLLKEEIVKLKDEGKVLLRVAELKQHLEMRMPSESFTQEELCTVVGLLVSPGVVWQLEFGDFVLLQPERVNAYAAAVIRTVRAHTDEIGCIPEARVMAGDLDYQDMKRLPQAEEQIVLRAMHQTFVDHGLCLRENTEAGTLLVFPSYFKRERPELDKHPLPLITYLFSGMVDEIYATLVVRLHHTLAFDKDLLWRFAADFRTLAGKRVGLKLMRRPEGAAEITVYCEPEIPIDTKVAFIRYVHEHLKAKDPKVKRERHYICEYCQSAIEDRQAVQKRLNRGLRDILCVNCENRVQLWDLIEEKFASAETQATVRAMDEQVRRAIDNESRELILIGHAFAIAGEAGQIFRPTPNSDWGIDGEIEFKNNNGEASGQRVYLQLKSGDSYMEPRKDGKEIFRIKKERHTEYWTAQEYPVMLVIRTSDGQIRWMNVTEYLNKQGKTVKQIVFDGEPFTAASLWRMRDRVLQQPFA
ncbi:MAG TPA: TIR domain-containing protein [Blastocatellia bacterium]|nr:TIR domain-containing protein [Blastocatellia bacterium]HMX25331.1 TIR domain-containing protein [Blastocatellia bacterium]HMY71770.1 TIR domain-containing protein [Blastocatellia bacterium]HMZ17591.1 TIR domain-containing protein [Blastocatellia bacterium]HNG33650.1 TIR domain-containing protein [Blastocatellia bacterium]